MQEYVLFHEFTQNLPPGVAEVVSNLLFKYIFSLGMSLIFLNSYLKFSLFPFYIVHIAVFFSTWNVQNETISQGTFP